MPPRAGLNLQSIVKAATVLADEHGLHEVTLTVLAKKLGIRSPSLYNHVNGLPGLRREMALTGLDQRLKQQILPFLKMLKQETTLPMIYVTHHIEELEYLDAHVLTLEQGSLI